MELINIIVATVAAFALGAVYYGRLAEPWMAAVGLPRGADGRPQGGMNPALLALGFVMQLLVAGMMSHIFRQSGIVTAGAGLVGGAGVGLFLISPWIVLNNAYAMRPFRLSLIDGGYATLACAVIGLVLALF
ncbi:DUF1761 domain-containing protein [Albidovulum sp.]